MIAADARFAEPLAQAPLSREDVHAKGAGMSAGYLRIIAAARGHHRRIHVYVCMRETYSPGSLNLSFLEFLSLNKTFTLTLKALERAAANFALCKEGARDHDRMCLYLLRETCSPG